MKKVVHNFVYAEGPNSYDPPTSYIGVPLTQILTDEFSADVYKWLEENAQGEVIISPIEAYDFGFAAEFHFENEDDATLFKLTWC